MLFIFLVEIHKLSFHSYDIEVFVNFFFFNNNLVLLYDKLFVFGVNVDNMCLNMKNCRGEK